MTGGTTHIGHVYFTDCHVPVSCRLGPENEGWMVAVQALQNERLGAPRYLGSLAQLEELKDYAMKTPVNGHTLFDEPLVRQRFAQLTAEAKVAQLSYYRQVSEAAAGSKTPVISSVARIQATTSNQNVSRFTMELLGPLCDVAEEDQDWVPLDGEAGERWSLGLVHTIVAGTLEINKNQLAQRGLGLPR